MILLVLILEDKADLTGTGAIAFPSNDVIEQAPADLKERLRAIESVDLSKSYGNLEGRQTRLRFVRWGVPVLRSVRVEWVRWVGQVGHRVDKWLNLYVRGCGYGCGCRCGCECE